MLLSKLALLLIANDLKIILPHCQIYHNGWDSKLLHSDNNFDDANLNVCLRAHFSTIQIGPETSIDGA